MLADKARRNPAVVLTRDQPETFEGETRARCASSTGPAAARSSSRRWRRPGAQLRRADEVGAAQPHPARGAEAATPLRQPPSAAQAPARGHDGCRRLATATTGRPAPARRSTTIAPVLSRPMQPPPHPYRRRLRRIAQPAPRRPGPRDQGAPLTTSTCGGPHHHRASAPPHTAAHERGGPASHGPAGSTPARARRTNHRRGTMTDPTITRSPACGRSRIADQIDRARQTASARLSATSSTSRAPSWRASRPSATPWPRSSPRSARSWCSLVAPTLRAMRPRISRPTRCRPRQGPRGAGRGAEGLRDPQLRARPRPVHDVRRVAAWYARADRRVPGADRRARAGSGRAKPHGAGVRGVSIDELCSVYSAAYGERPGHRDDRRPDAIRAVLARLEVSLVAPVDPEAVARAYHDHKDAPAPEWDGSTSGEAVTPTSRPTPSPPCATLTARGIPVTPGVDK